MQCMDKEKCRFSKINGPDMTKNFLKTVQNRTIFKPVSIMFYVAGHSCEIDKCIPVTRVKRHNKEWAQSKLPTDPVLQIQEVYEEIMGEETPKPPKKNHGCNKLTNDHKMAIIIIFALAFLCM